MDDKSDLVFLSLAFALVLFSLGHKRSAGVGVVIATCSGRFGHGECMCMWVLGRPGLCGYILWGE